MVPCHNENNLPCLFVRESTPLGQIEAIADRGPCVLVSDEFGEIVGVVHRAEVMERLTQGHPRERERWAKTPLSALLTARLPPSAGSAMVAGKTEDVQHIYHKQRLIGVVSNDDILLSWDLVGPALSTAATDPLTGLANRMTYDRRIGEEWERAKRLNQSIAVIMCDIDQFKPLNDTYGHPFGDQVIRQIASTLETSLRSYDLVSRYGGDEFICLMVGLRPNEIQIPLLRIQSRFQALRFQANGSPVRVSASLGAAISHVGFRESTPQDLIEKADRCLYRAKAKAPGTSLYVEQLTLNDAEEIQLASPETSPFRNRNERIPEEQLQIY
ncbi:MAG: diguanylate cyclase [Planctomycetaceae bacterium]|nr:diguanylate cyclase [Planctomycetaceae bacterium]